MSTTPVLLHTISMVLACCYVAIAVDELVGCLICDVRSKIKLDAISQFAVLDSLPNCEIFHKANEILRSLGVTAHAQYVYNPAQDDVIDTDDTNSVHMIGGNPDMRSIEDILRTRITLEENAPEDDSTNDVSPDILELPPQTSRRRKRFVLNDARRQWTHGIIPYIFDKSLPKAYRNNYVHVVFRQLEYWTHFRFVPWNASVPHLYALPHQNYLIFLRAGSRCFSYLGNIRKLRGQRISCCRGTRCLHEIGHALGFYHEQANPLRDDYIRINYDNILPGTARSFQKERLRDKTQHFGYYDGSSVMGYTSNAFSKNGFDTISILDDDAYHLGHTRDFTGFYMFYEAQKLYRMQATKCPDFPLRCVNDGYVSYTNGTCRCRCTPGMDYRTGCSTPVGTDIWPEGTYSVLRDGAYCPPGFHYQETSSMSYNNHLTLCIKRYSQQTDSGFSWSPGDYCVFKLQDSNCPQAFQEEHIGSQSSSEYQQQESLMSSYMSLCCRHDGQASTPIQLPTTRPFILPTRKNITCQQMQGTMTSDVYPSQLTQLGLKGCSYRKHKDISPCGDMVNLGEFNKHVVVTSPQYPADYTAMDSCTWFIQGPPGSQIKLEFTEFELHVSDQSCSGHVEIRPVLPGQPGTKYCGSGFLRTVLSHSNSLQFMLTSHSLTNGSLGAAVNRRFNASVSLVTENDLCYTSFGKDNSYHGYANITRNFKPCLYWSKVTTCRHHLFSKTKVDLVKNYCRNPGDGTQPWCYTDANNCAREYCDVCNLRRCYDLFQDCNELIEIDAMFCINDPEAARGCRLACGLCGDIATHKSVSTIACTHPSNLPPDDVLVSEAKVKYSVGDKITYSCNGTRQTSTNTTRQIVCTSEGAWSHIGTVCEGSLVCVDDRADCVELLQDSPRMCKDYRAFAAETCANTCGLCSQNNRLDVKGGCHLQEAFVNVSRANSGPLVQGDVVQYTCQPGFALKTGDLYRACQENGQLTGNDPVCVAQNETTTELLHVPLRRRRDTGRSNKMYILSSEQYRINRTGEIVVWKFYSLHRGRVQFQVWRQMRKRKWFRLIGTNDVDTRADRLMSIYVADGNRIRVVPGDYVAIYFPATNPGSVTFDPCKGYFNPEGVSQWTPLRRLGKWRPGKTYPMRRQNDCKLFSVSAMIGPNT